MRKEDGAEAVASQELKVRRMDESGIALALEWADAEGWNPGRHDASCFYAADPRGFFLGELDGEPVGCISAVAYDGTFGFLGLYIVKPPYRGRGFGLKLWNTAMDYMGARNVGLDGVVAQQDNYRKSGFKLAYRNMRYQGTGGGTEPAGLVQLSSIGFDEICRYDATVFPVPRVGLLRRWIDQPQVVALGVLSGNRLAGYGVARASRSGFRIGPLFADAAHVAGALFEGLSSRLRGEPIFLDTTEANPRSAELAQRYGMEPMFETARMYTGGIPNVQSDRCFGLTSLEIG
ncbi:GNAT family N-acetyltransferase [Rhodomicrobium lacus]|uniref:GNAT family N-acetyltransferase n=1 Tax=Rhodomicrobium lacus TaxID=2498452 RepID=UPI000F8C9120|nr:GNAT family N-acetyltransferase [Rhodomicrobium lacus]